MTLYYPEGSYGPICDILPPSEVEPIVREVVLPEPNIDVGVDPDGGEDTPITIPKLIPKICRTVSVTSLYGGPFGPICDLSPSGDTNALTLCNIDPPTVPPKYRPLGGLPPELPFDVPNLECKSKTILLSTPSGDQTFTYYFECKPSITDYDGPDPEDYGIDTKVPKITYKYTHSLVCGATDYFSSPGKYTQTVPQGISVITLVVIGGGGGAGGIDGAVSNNSGGSGSIAYATLTLDPMIENKLEYVVGGGGYPGIGAHNRPENTRPGFNRGGKGGHPGPLGISGAGGSGGGATDVFLNGRLVMSIAGGGGGGGNGCNPFPSVAGSPWGNWNNYTFSGSKTVSSDALKRSKFSPLMAVSVFEPSIKHSLWSNWFKEYVVWFNEGEDTAPGKQLENRVNLEFPVTGTYTIEFEGDNQLALYIAPWYDSGDGDYIVDNLYNGSALAIRDNTLNNNTIPVDSAGVLLPPSTLPANVSGAAPWTYLGYTTNFTSETPTTVTYNVTTPGRYVLRTFLENAFGDPTKTDWLLNPGGMAIVIKKPDGSILWTTKSAFGNSGQNRSSDGPGAGGGGANEGRSGLSSDGLGLASGSCQAGDATAQGGSAGWSYVIDHPAVSLLHFGQAPSGMVSGWHCPNGGISNVPVSDQKVLCHAGGGSGGLKGTQTQSAVGKVIVGTGGSGSPGRAPGKTRPARTQDSGGGAGLRSGSASEWSGATLDGLESPLVETTEGFVTGPFYGQPYGNFWIPNGADNIGNATEFSAYNGAYSADVKSGYGYGGALQFRSNGTNTISIAGSPSYASRFITPPMSKGGNGAVKITYGSQSQSFTQPGIYEFQVPTGVEFIDIVCIGAGGSAYVAKADASLSYSVDVLNDSGGAGGAYAFVEQAPVTPGAKLLVYVGAGGAYVPGGSDDGQDSFVAITTTLNTTPTWYPVAGGISAGLWNDLMNNYAVFPKVVDGIGVSDNLEHTLTYKFNVETAGKYTLEYASDNYGTWFINGQEVAKLTMANGGDGSTFTRNYDVQVNLIPGTCSLTMTVKAISGGTLNGVPVAVNSPAGIAWKLTDPNGQIVATSRDLALTRNDISSILDTSQSKPKEDITSRKAYGGFGGGRPIKFSLVYNGTEYPLQDGSGAFTTVTIPGMGNNVWEDFVNGKTFQYPYFWGVTTNESPSSEVPTLLDISEDFAKILLGPYEGAVNSTASQRPLLTRARSLQLNLQWTPVSTGTNTWDTQIKITGMQPWGLGAGFEVNDILPGVMPPLKTQGTQPWFDVTFGNGTDEWDLVYQYDPVSGKTRSSVKTNTSFNFSIKVTDIGNWDEYTPTSGGPGFVGVAYYTVDYTYEEQVIE